MFRYQLFSSLSNTPYMPNLMNFWLRYLRLKTIDVFQKIILFHLFLLPIISNISSSNSKIRNRFLICLSWGFKNWHWILKLIKKWLRYSSLKSRPNFWKDDENMNLTSSVQSKGGVVYFQERKLTYSIQCKACIKCLDLIVMHYIRKDQNNRLSLF